MQEFLVFDNPEGGQWTSDGSNGGGSAKDEKESADDSSNDNENSENSEDENTKELKDSSEKSIDENSKEKDYKWDYENPSGSVCMKKDENSSLTSFEVLKDANGENKKVSFADPDKTNPQNLESVSMDDVAFTSDPQKGIMLNRDYKKTGEVGFWNATTIKIEGFESNKPYTLLFRVKCTCLKNDEPYEEEVTVAYDVISDDKGRIVAERLHILNTLEQEGISLTDVKLELDASYFEGSVADNLLANPAYTGKEESYSKDNDKTTSDSDKGNVNKDKTMLFFSMAQHARIASFNRNKNIQSYSQNNGGGIEFYQETPTPIFTSTSYIKE